MSSFLKLSVILILLTQSFSEAYILRVCNLVPIPIVTTRQGQPTLPILDKILAVNVQATEPETEEPRKEKKVRVQEPLPEFIIPPHFFLDPDPFEWYRRIEARSITSEDMRRAG